MEGEGLVERIDFGGQPPHVEYRLTERGLLLLPLVEALRQVGLALGCNECEDRRERLGLYCEACPLNDFHRPRSSPQPLTPPGPRRFVCCGIENGRKHVRLSCNKVNQNSSGANL